MNPLITITDGAMKKTGRNRGAIAPLSVRPILVPPLSVTVDLLPDAASLCARTDRFNDSIRF